MQVLTDRERELFHLLTQTALSNKQIASELKIAEFTVKHHVTMILAKLHVQTRIDLLINYWKHGMYKTT